MDLITIYLGFYVLIFDYLAKKRSKMKILFNPLFRNNKNNYFKGVFLVEFFIFNCDLNPAMYLCKL